MSKVEYFHVFESIIYGLVTARFLQGWYYMIKTKGNKNYWAHLMTTIYLFVGFTQRYYIGLNNPGFELVTNYSSFLFIVILTPSLFFFVGVILFPDEKYAVDYKVFFQKRLRLFLVLFTFLLIQATMINISTVMAIHDLSLIEVINSPLIFEAGLLLTNITHLLLALLSIFVIIRRNLKLYEIGVLGILPYFLYLMFK
ncbi:MAG: hypothetical protein R8G66_16490 [Cytophagales bacterium]|nr:hypothetical protein [Cytophagales bacterium]